MNLEGSVSCHWCFNKTMGPWKIAHAAASAASASPKWFDDGCRRDLRHAKPQKGLHAPSNDFDQVRKNNMEQARPNSVPLWAPYGMSSSRIGGDASVVMHDPA